MQAIHNYFVNILLYATLLTPIQEQNNQFLGTWEANANGKLFRITLFNNSNYQGPDGKSYDVILGKCVYSKGASLIEQSLPEQEYSLFGVPTTGDTLKLGYQDFILKKRGRVVLTLLPNNQLRWQLRNSAETITINAPSPENTGFTAPKDIVLKRVM